MADLEHKEALELISDDWRADADNRDDAMEDLRFAANDQWDQADRDERNRENRPCLTINRLKGPINQVGGAIRQAQPAIEVFPVDSDEDINTADVLAGIIRQIEYQSAAQSAYAHAAESSTRCGIGWWRYVTERPKDSVFEQEICIERVLDPLSIIVDADAQKVDRSDATRLWATEWLSDRSFKSKHKRSGSDVPIDGGGRLASTSGLYWQREEFVRQAEYWYMDPEDRFVVLTADGRSIDITDLPIDVVRFFQMDETSPQVEKVRKVIQGYLKRAEKSGKKAREGDFTGAAGITVMDAAKVEGHKVKRRLMDGSDWLDDPVDWAGKFIPFVATVGSEIAFDGRVVREGLIRSAKDAQRLYNASRSATIETIMRAPKTKVMLTEKMLDGHEDEWATVNRSNAGFVTYNADPAAPQGTPQPLPQAEVPVALIQETVNAADDVRVTTNVHEAGLGQQGNETSGIAIANRQRQGDTSNFIFTDNFLLSMRYGGKILVDLIPRIYDTQRQALILDKEGNRGFAPINTEVLTLGGERIIINDLSRGRYDVRTAAGTSSMTARIEAREQMKDILQGNPEMFAIIGDLYVKSLDLPNGDEIAERLKRSMNPALFQDQDQQQDPQEELQSRLNQALAQAELQKTESETEKNMAQARKLEAEADDQELENAESIGNLADAVDNAQHA